MKITKSFRFDEEVIEHSRNNPLISSFADFCCEVYKKKFMNIEEKAKKLEKLCKEVEYLRADLQKIKCEDVSKLLPSKEYFWMKTEGVKRLEKATFKGVFNYFNNRFKSKLNPRQFRILMDRIKNKKTED